MNESAVSRSASRSVFHEGTPSVETYTKLWIKLINQSERGQRPLSASR